MVFRIEKTTLTVNQTQDPSIVEVSADVTKDDITVQAPKMHRVTVLWNTSTPKSALKDLMRLAIKEDALQADLRASIGEDILPAPAPIPAPDLIIYAASVTVIQSPKIQPITEPIEAEIIPGGL